MLCLWEGGMMAGPQRLGDGGEIFKRIMDKN